MGRAIVKDTEKRWGHSGRERPLFGIQGIEFLKMIYLQEQEEIRKKTELINSKQAFLDRQEKENKERSKKIANDEALLAKTRYFKQNWVFTYIRLEQSEGNIELLELQDQLYLMQTGVRNCTFNVFYSLKL